MGEASKRRHQLPRALRSAVSSSAGRRAVVAGVSASLAPRSVPASCDPPPRSDPSDSSPTASKGALLLSYVSPEKSFRERFNVCPERRERLSD
jgi:hypothetical protein